MLTTSDYSLVRIGVNLFNTATSFTSVAHHSAVTENCARDIKIAGAIFTSAVEYFDNH